MSVLGSTAKKPRPLVDLEPTNVTLEDLPRFPRMTSWFKPSLLSKLLLRVIVSDLFGQYADRRLIQAALDPVDAATLRARADLTKHMVAAADGAIWFDYVADLGDGFDATYAIAYLLAQPSLDVDGHATHRGSALVMGGDQVYPTATGDEYRVRMRKPYSFAFPPDEAQEPTPLLLLPGNHDWYDGLVAFLSMFCRQRPLRIGGWRTCQHRSYFAAKLTDTCWIWAIDIALVRDMDQPQEDYFVAIAKDMPEHANIILCSAEPGWYEAEAHGDAFRTIAYAVGIANDAKKDLRIPLVLSGDSHHYARYSGDDVQYITSGGGGAFMHGTINLREKIHADLLTKNTLLSLKTTADETHAPCAHEACYPTKEESAALLDGNLNFFCLNPQFSFFLGGIYALISLLVTSLRDWDDPASTWDVVLVAYAILFLRLYAYTGYQEGYTLRVAWLSAVHAAAHLVAALALSWLVWRVASCIGPAAPAWHWLAWFALTLIIIVPIGGAVAGTIFGINLFVTCRWFGLNHNDAFSAMRIEGFKQFLRIRILGDLIEVYPIAIDTVPSRTGWIRNPDYPARPTAPVFKPVHPLQPKLIEGPIVIRTMKAPTTAKASDAIPAPPRAQPTPRS
jgi:hypothetical protein